MERTIFSSTFSEIGKTFLTVITLGSDVKPGFQTQIDNDHKLASFLRQNDKKVTKTRTKVEITSYSLGYGGYFLDDFFASSIKNLWQPKITVNVTITVNVEN